MDERSPVKYRAVTAAQRRRRQQGINGAAPRRSAGAHPPLIDPSALERYGRTRLELLDLVRSLEAQFSGEHDVLSQMRARLERKAFVLAVVGEFSSGKSFLLNALLGKFGLLATDINPSTATITELEYGAEVQAHAHYESGRVARVPVDQLSKFVASDDEPPVRVVVHVDSTFLQRGFSVADTPGLASINPAHRRATLQFLPAADAVLYLIDTQQPFSEGDASFLNIIRAHLDTIFIVQTKIDLWEQRSESGAAAWELAAQRIQQLAAVHAPGAYVYAVSAKLFSEGAQAHDDALIERSRFPAFTAALDASLVRTTGRERIKRVRDAALLAATDERAAIDRDRAMLARSQATLRSDLAEAKPQVDALETFAKQEQERAAAGMERTRVAFSERGAEIVDEAQRALGQAFDTADIARLRDRERLHIIVDRTLGTSVETFATEVAAAVFADYTRSLQRARERLPVRFEIGTTAANAFGSEGSSHQWSDDPQRGLASTIVLEAIGGPAIALVTDIAARFANAPPGSYMKRELTADLRASMWPAFSQSMHAFAQDIIARLATVQKAYAGAIDEAVKREHDARIGSIERALATLASGLDAAQASAQLEAKGNAIAGILAQIDAAAATFLEAREEIAAADPGAEAVRRAHIGAEFDRTAYERGLRPQRWRVAVLGALRRGKSSLINAFAGRRVLTDEIAGAIAYPVHVRYGEHEQAFALEGNGEWREIEIENALEEATRNPVLILTPWNLPRELVLVHAPAFDAGGSALEDVGLVAATEASEVLCLFSRQLSDRELALYERVADLGKPMLFAHTLADNETAEERRGVVTLAQQYLSERSIPAQRIFTVSTLEHAQARREGRAAAPWNELDALISTIGAHAEEHMARLARLERAGSLPAKPAGEPPTAHRRRGLFERLWKR